MSGAGAEEANTPFIAHRFTAGSLWQEAAVLEEWKSPVLIFAVVDVQGNLSKLVADEVDLAMGSPAHPRPYLSLIRNGELGSADSRIES